MLTTYIIRAAGGGTRLAGVTSPDLLSLAPDESASVASAADIAEHEARIAGLVAAAAAEGRAAAEPTEHEVLLEALRAQLTPVQIAAARQRLKARVQAP